MQYVTTTGHLKILVSQKENFFPSRYNNSLVNLCMSKAGSQFVMKNTFFNLPDIRAITGFLLMESWFMETQFPSAMERVICH